MALGPGRIYLNNAGTTWPKPDVVLARISASLMEPPSALVEQIDGTSRIVARQLGLPSVEGLLWTPGCTAALGAALGGLAWSDGDRVVTSALEHHAMDAPVQRLVRDRGVVHDVVPHASDHPFDLDFLRATLRRGGVRLVAFTAASNVTGELLPAQEIVALAHEHGALCLIDAAQTAGVVPIDVRALGVDLICFAGHKGPLGPQGVGALWAAPDVPFDCPAASCSVEDRGRYQAPGYCDVGGMNLAGIVGVGAGFEWLAQHREASLRACRLATRLIGELRGRPGVRVFGGDGPRTAAVSFGMCSLPLERAEEHFDQRGIVVRAGAHCAPRAIEAIGAEQGTIRVSFGVFSRESDVDAVLDAVDACRPS